VLPGATTDAEGRFTVAGAGAERLVTLRLRGTGIAESELWVVNRDGFDPKPYNQATADKNAAKPSAPPVWRRLLYGPELNFVADAEKPIRGVVKDVDTGRPKAGVKVWLMRENHDPLPIPLMGMTDPEGRYEIRGAHKANSYQLEAASDPVAGHVAAQVDAADTVGYRPVVADVGVKKGVVVTGKAIDAGTKKPLRAFVLIDVLEDNPFVKEYPQFDRLVPLCGGETAEDGSFRVVTIPGPVLLAVGVWRDADAPKQYKPLFSASLKKDYRALDAAMNRLGKFRLPDPKHPQDFDGRPNGVWLPFYCMALDVKPDVEVVTQDVILEPAK
jgi:hypothetical protein